MDTVSDPSSANSIAPDSRKSWTAALGGTALFILWGLAMITGEFPHEWAFPIWIQGVFFVGLIFVLPVGMCIGWIGGFPHWSYPYVGHVLIFSLYMTMVATPGFLFDREMWGWRAWIPFLVVSVIALAFTRSLKPISKFFTNIWDDWTLLTFGMFGFMPLLVMIGFDEVDRLYSLYFMVILTLLMSGAAWSYIRADTQRRRIVALFIGITLAIAVTVIAPSLYWEKNGWVFPMQTAMMGAIIVLFMFSPAVIGLIRRTDRDIKRLGPQN